MRWQAFLRADKIEENIKELLDAILKAKPASAKGNYMKSFSLLDDGSRVEDRSSRNHK